MKILIADDDLLIRNGLRSIMNRRCPEHIVVGEASDGASAFDLVCELQPDLLITDMKMPKMDGIQLIKKLRQSQKENVQIIVLSGYDDYEYIRQSMKNKAEDYLLKPVDEEELVSLIQKIGRELESLAQMKDTVRPQTDVAVQKKEKALHNLVEGVSDDTRGLGLKDFFTGVVGLYSIDFVPQAALQNHLEFEIMVLRNELSKQMIQEYFASSEDLRVIVAEFHGDLVVFLYAERFVKDFLKRVRKEFSVIRRLLSDYSNLTVSSGVGPPLEHPGQIRENYQLAQEALYYRFYWGNGLYFYGEHKWSQKPAFNSARYKELCTELIDDITLCRTVEAKQHLQQLFACLREPCFHPFRFCEYLIELIHLIYDSVGEFRELCVDYSANQDVLKSVVEKYTISQDLEKAFTDTVLECIRELELNRFNRNIQYIEMSKKYIRDHYMEQISLKDVAQFVHLNHSYLSELFKSKTGKNFIDYLTEVRINEAKKLLSDPTNKIYQISESVGYMDSASFTRAFKKQTGIAPVEYRKIIK